MTHLEAVVIVMKLVGDQMNKNILKTVGFTNEVKLVEENKCPLCERIIDMKSFRDKLSLKEFQVSGLCQDCQDEIFNPKNEEFRN